MPVELNKSIYKSPEDAKIAEVKMANDVISMIAAIAAEEVEGVDSLWGNTGHELIEKLSKKNLAKCIILNVKDGNVRIRVRIVIKYGYVAPEVCSEVQERVKTAITNMTGMNVQAVDVSVCGMELS